MADPANKPFPDGEFTPAELKALGHCNALTNQEAKIVLMRFIETTQKNNKTWAPPALTQKAMDYLNKVEKTTQLNHSDTVQRLRETVQAANVYEYEMALLANLTPQSADEALALIPGLGSQDRFGGEEKQVLENMVEEILTLKELQ